jgi:type III pantothenate kinase
MDFLAIDVGNSRIKTLYQSKNSGSDYHYFYNEQQLNEYLQTLHLSSVYLIICDVGNKLSNIFFNKVELFKHYIILNHKTPLPIKNFYETPNTLGYDRIASVVGAIELFPDINSLVIDAGTAITYDIITKNKEYLGGAISPGINLRFKALNEFTANLPLETFKNISTFPAKNTSNCIKTGVIEGVLAEIEHFIEDATIQFSPLQTIITGGDSTNLVKYLKKTIFVEENLVLIGLINILKHNVL